MKKQLIAKLLVLVMVLAMVPVATLAIDSGSGFMSGIAVSKSGTYNNPYDPYNNPYNPYNPGGTTPGGNTPGGRPSGGTGGSGGSGGGSVAKPAARPGAGSGSGGGTETSGTNFRDVSSSAYYADAVQWAVEQGITLGTSDTTFSPNAPCTRAQIVTFLWRAAGSPAATGTNPFTDVTPGSYYYDAVLWAVANGITTGTTATTFGPSSTCTRGQTVTFLYRYEQSPQTSGGNPFNDVSSDAYYADAVSWAVRRGVTAGTSATTFDPNSTCTRAQIVTFLYRDMA